MKTRYFTVIVNTKTILFSSLILTLFFSFGLIPADAYPSPYQQIKNGVALHDVQCNNDKVLVEFSDVKIACVNESTAEKRNLKIIAIMPASAESLPTADELDISTTTIIGTMSAPEITPKITEKSINSIVHSVEFNVQSTDTYDDNNMKTNGFSDGAPRRPAPRLLTMFENQYNTNQIVEGRISFSESTMNSITRDLSPYMWIPAYTPDGMNLILNSWTNDEKFYLYLLYAPNTYNVDENTTNHNIWDNHGLDIQVYDNSVRTNGLESFEEYREDRLESIAIVNDFGVIDYTFNGHVTLSSNGDGYSRPSVIEYADDEYLVSVISYGHSFDELKTVFESMWYT